MSLPLSEPVKHVIDSSSMAATLLAVMQLVPDITALLSLIWVLIRLYETKTVQKWLNKTQKKIIQDEIEEE